MSMRRLLLFLSTKRFSKSNLAGLPGNGLIREMTQVKPLVMPVTSGGIARQQLGLGETTLSFILNDNYREN